MAKVTEEDGKKSPDVEAQEKDTRFSRRSFLTGLGATGVAATAQPLLAAVAEQPARQAGEETETGTVPLVLSPM